MKQEREKKLQAKIHREAEEMQETSERVRKQLLEEFSDVFAEPTTLPHLRWENHEINFEEGAKNATGARITTNVKGGDRSDARFPGGLAEEGLD